MSLPAALPMRSAEHVGSSALAESLDPSLTERIERALQGTGFSALRAITVNVRDQLVILSGRVHSYHVKQIAQATILRVPGTQQIRNDLEVVSQT